MNKYTIFNSVSRVRTSKYGETHARDDSQFFAIILSHILRGGNVALSLRQITAKINNGVVEPRLLGKVRRMLRNYTSDSEVSSMLLCGSSCIKMEVEFYNILLKSNMYRNPKTGKFSNKYATRKPVEVKGENQNRVLLPGTRGLSVNLLRSSAKYEQAILGHLAWLGPVEFNEAIRNLHALKIGATEEKAA